MLLFGQSGDHYGTVTSSGTRAVESIDDVNRTTDLAVGVGYAAVFTHSSVTSVRNDNDLILTTIDLKDVALAVGFDSSCLKKKINVYFTHMYITQPAIGFPIRLAFDYGGRHAGQTRNICMESSVSARTVYRYKRDLFENDF